MTAVRGLRVPLWLPLLLTVAGAASEDLRKPAPDAPAQPYRARLEAIIKARYPQLLTERVQGIARVTVLLSSDGGVSDTSLEILPMEAGSLTASEAQFARFGLAPGELRYVGEARIALGGSVVLVVFGARDSREVDRALVERFFPGLMAHGEAPGKGVWILLDHQGRVLRSGEEAFEPERLRQMLERRFPGIRTADMTASPLYARDGHPILNAGSARALQLYCVWLAADSPLPQEK